MLFRSMIDVQWDRTKNAEYDAHVTIVANDRKGLFSDLSRVCESNDVRITGVHTGSIKGGVINITLTLSIVGVQQMEKLQGAFKQVPSVLEVYRARI